MLNLLLTSADFDYLYSLPMKFENQNLDRCKQCNCGQSLGGKDIFVFLYPGEYEYRREKKLFPVFTDTDTKIMPDGAILYKCPLIATGTANLCEESTLNCKMSPFQFIKQNKNQLTEIRRSCSSFHTCPLKTYSAEYVENLLKAVVYLFYRGF